MRFSCGVDVGYAKLGMAWTDHARQYSILEEHDLTLASKKKLHWEEFGAAVRDLFASMAGRFAECAVVGIERTPQGIYNEYTGRTERPNPLVVRMEGYVEQTIRLMYPHVEVFFTDMGTVRKMVGSTGGKSRAERKKLSLATQTLAPADKLRYKKTFGANADAMEALHHSIYIHETLAAHRKRRPTPPKNRKFGLKALMSPFASPQLSKHQRQMLEEEDDATLEADMAQMELVAIEAQSAKKEKSAKAKESRDKAKARREKNAATERAIAKQLDDMRQLELWEEASENHENGESN